MSRTFNTHLLLRLAALLAAVLLSLLALGIWMQSLANEMARIGHLTSAREHYAVVLAELDRRWGREAFNLKSRIESQNLLGGSKADSEHLLAFLIAQGSSIEFPSLRIEKTNGEVIAAYDYASHVDPKVKFVPGQASTWAQNAADGSLYLVIRQFIWLGKENGYLLLFKPMDHLLMTQTTYPGTRLSLWWKGQALASSDGEDGLQPTIDRFPKPENSDNSVVLTWSGPETENAPKLLIEILSDELIGMISILKPVALAFMFIAITIAVSFSALWIRATRQLNALLHSEQRIESLNALDDNTLSTLRVAQSGPVDALASLAEAMERRMRKNSAAAETERSIQHK